MAGRRRILVVDDEQEIIDILSEYLSEAHEVEPAMNAVQALDRIAARRPDIVLLDINMPGLNGVEALALIKKVDATIPVLMITANTDNEMAAQAITLGALSYIPKPFNLKYLDHLIEIALAR